MKSAARHSETTPTEAQAPLSPRLPGKAPSQQILGAILCAGILFSLAAGVVVWRSRNTARTPKIRRGEFPRMQPNGFRRFSGGMMMLGMGPDPRFGGGMRGAFGRFEPPPEPRYVANLVGTTGAYIVSVRQVLSDGRGGYLYFNPAPEQLQRRTQLPDIVLSMQVMSASDAAMARVADFASDLVVYDDTGHRLDVMDTHRIVRFSHGCSRMIRLKAPAPNARFLKRIEGGITLGAPGVPPTARLAEETLLRKGAGSPVRAPGGPVVPVSLRQVEKGPGLKFQIENVPLPMTTHVYGVAAARFLDTATAARVGAEGGGNEIQILTGTRAKELRGLFPPFTEEPGPLHLPTRLILVPEATNRFQVPIPALSSGGSEPPALQCTLTPRLGPDGEIALKASAAQQGAGGPAAEIALSAWDNAPFLLVIPAKHPAIRATANRPLALWLHLFLDMPPPERLGVGQAPVPFPAVKGERGGALVGQLKAGGEPLGLGVINVRVTRLDEHGTPQGKPLTVETTLDSEGKWGFANLSPGRYRVQLLEVQPYLSQATTASSLPNYLRRRFGVKTFGWQNETQENVIVRAGGQTRLLPWQME
ncbi:MAG TPA: hypothetical protein VFB21_10260 [Chthonomonadaceae bacterium]|nr:hypothetical protein [Chthonomonadaceae bacterium]